MDLMICLSFLFMGCGLGFMIQSFLNVMRSRQVLDECNRLAGAAQERFKIIEDIHKKAQEIDNNVKN